MSQLSRRAGAEEVEELWFNAEAQHELAQLHGVENCLACPASVRREWACWTLASSALQAICRSLPMLLRGTAGAEGGAGLEEVRRRVAPSLYWAAKEDKAFFFPL